MPEQLGRWQALAAEVSKRPAQQWLCVLLDRLTRRGNRLRLPIGRCSARETVALDVYHADFLRILDAEKGPDPLLDALLAALEEDVTDPASLAALEDFLQERDPPPMKLCEPPAWLCKRWLAHVKRRRDPVSGGLPASVRKEIDAALRHETGEHVGLEHLGTVWLGGREACASDPDLKHQAVRDQAEILRDALGVVAVGLPTGAWSRGVSRLLIFRPSEPGKGAKAR
jgi:hypothetical protein